MTITTDPGHDVVVDLGSDLIRYLYSCDVRKDLVSNSNVKFSHVLELYVLREFAKAYMGVRGLMCHELETKGKTGALSATEQVFLANSALYASRDIPVNMRGFIMNFLNLRPAYLNVGLYELFFEVAQDLKPVSQFDRMFSLISRHWKNSDLKITDRRKHFTDGLTNICTRFSDTVRRAKGPVDLYTCNGGLMELEKLFGKCAFSAALSPKLRKFAAGGSGSESTLSPPSPLLPHGCGPLVINQNADSPVSPNTDPSRAITGRLNGDPESHRQDTRHLSASQLVTLSSVGVSGTNRFNHIGNTIDNLMAVGITMTEDDLFKLFGKELVAYYTYLHQLGPEGELRIFKIMGTLLGKRMRVEALPDVSKALEMKTTRLEPKCNPIPSPVRSVEFETESSEINTNTDTEDDVSVESTSSHVSTTDTMSEAAFVPRPPPTFNPVNVREVVVDPRLLGPVAPGPLPPVGPTAKPVTLPPVMPYENFIVASIKQKGFTTLTRDLWSKIQISSGLWKSLKHAAEAMCCFGYMYFMTKGLFYTYGKRSVKHGLLALAGTVLYMLHRHNESAWKTTQPVTVKWHANRTAVGKIATFCAYNLTCSKVLDWLRMSFLKLPQAAPRDIVGMMNDLRPAGQVEITLLSAAAGAVALWLRAPLPNVHNLGNLAKASSLSELLPAMKGTGYNHESIECVYHCALEHCQVVAGKVQPQPWYGEDEIEAVLSSGTGWGEVVDQRPLQDRGVVLKATSVANMLTIQAYDLDAYGNKRLVKVYAQVVDRNCLVHALTSSTNAALNIAEASAIMNKRIKTSVNCPTHITDGSTENMFYRLWALRESRHLNMKFGSMDPSTSMGTWSVMCHYPP